MSRPAPTGYGQKVYLVFDQRGRVLDVKLTKSGAEVLAAATPGSTIEKRIATK